MKHVEENAGERETVYRW